MPRLRVHHKTVYEYNRPVEFGEHRLVLRPREGYDLHVEKMKLHIFPEHQIVWMRDVFGNSIAHVNFLKASEELVIDSDLTLTRHQSTHPEDQNPPWEIVYPFEYDPLEQNISNAYQKRTYPGDAPAIKTWLEGHFPDRDHVDALSIGYQLGKIIHEEIKYNRRMEKGVQTPSQTLELKSGSCRDMATLMLDALRELGFAARFASGYLTCQASEAGRASMHAWIEFYLPKFGWRGFDPTIGEPTSIKHIVVGVSDHPRGVMPVSGSFHGTSIDFLQMNANVRIESTPEEMSYSE
jgi:transglutaminase-like putative cysteine protease